jgi:predicted secreted protein
MRAHLEMVNPDDSRPPVEYRDRDVRGHIMRPRILAAAVAVTATLILTSCVAGYDEATKDNLREQVVAVAEASAAGDWQAALNGLDVMAVELADARSEGKVSEERFDTIALAMELVRQDIDAAIAAAADAAEQQRLLEEQARLQEQIAQLQEQQNRGDQGNDDDKGEEDKSGEQDKNGEADKKGEEEKSE